MQAKSHKAKTRQRWLQLAVYLLCLGAIAISTTKMLTAGFSVDPLKTRVEIDGIDYGPFDIVEGLDSSEVIATSAGSYRRVTLTRDFVTDPSLYLWAKNQMRERSGLKNILLTQQSAAGETVVRYELKLCQPMSWTVEAAGPSMGGFHEKIEIAVQDVHIF